MVDLFQALGNPTRRNMLKLLMKKEYHISGLAKELNIAVPVILKHTKVLEKAGIIEREKIGNTHTLQIRKEALGNLEKVWGLLDKSWVLEVDKGSNMLEVLKKVSGITVENKPDANYITSVDGRKGIYIYEVNGKLPSTSIDQYKINKDVEVELKRLVPVIGKKIVIKVRDN